ncbi:NAD(P)H-dependent amine dehydrogenase family protein [Rhodococcus sp. P1Y]|uniref:NAD(P)H-dependent amine dehydrogenase family protein n=1 Tax=Rhodococcus sp. P1Y TaxID=1302308 RepID=UPI00137B45E2|nr:hypothetical protein [Rhodococcus sp. P1Y]
MVTRRIIQWSTGRVGVHTLRAVLDDAGLELVGVYAHSPDKKGVDAGDLCGRPKTGVLATSDVDDLLALEADCIVFTAREADTVTVERLLVSGSNVVCTTTFGSTALDDGYRATLKSACSAGNSSLYFTGVNPGWISTVAVGLTAPCRRVDKVTVSESCNVGTDPNVDFWLGHGFSRPLDTPGLAEFTRAAMLPFADTVQRVAAALDVQLDSIDYRTDYAASRSSVDLGWIHIEAGTIGALRTVWTGRAAGRAFVETAITWRLSEDLDCDWTMTDGAYVIEVDGEPSSRTVVEWDFPKSWSKTDFAILTAQPAVGSIGAVCDAPPGLLTLRDVGLPHAPVGRWSLNLSSHGQRHRIDED